MKKILFALVIVAILAITGYLVFGYGRTQEISQGIARKVVLPKRGDLRVTISATGQVQPVKTVEVKSKASGEIIELNYEAGDYVSKGDLLCRIDEKQVKHDFDKAEADLAVAEASAKLQEKEYKRQQDLSKQQLISESAMDAADLALEQARATVVRTRAIRDDAKENLDATVIRSPITGLILKNNVEAGQIIASGVSNYSGGTALMQIAQTDSVYVVADIDETDIGTVDVGQKVRVEADAFPDLSFSGEVLKIAPVALVQQNVTVFEVTTKVDNSERKLKSGMNANIEIVTAFAENALLVPNSAVKDPRKLMSGSSDTQTRMGGPPMGGEGGPPPGGPGGPGGPGQSSGSTRGASSKMGQGADANRKLVFVIENGEDQPRPVVVGVSNLDYTQILEGLAETDSIDATPTSRLAADRQQFIDRMSRFSSVPGMKKTTNTGK
jgi:HlyD family secretion protein